MTALGLLLLLVGCEGELQSPQVIRGEIDPPESTSIQEVRVRSEGSIIATSLIEQDVFLLVVPPGVSYTIEFLETKVAPAIRTLVDAEGMPSNFSVCSAAETFDLGRVDAVCAADTACLLAQGELNRCQESSAQSCEQLMHQVADCHDQRETACFNEHSELENCTLGHEECEATYIQQADCLAGFDCDGDRDRCIQQQQQGACEQLQQILDACEQQTPGQCHEQQEELTQCLEMPDCEQQAQDCHQQAETVCAIPPHCQPDQLCQQEQLAIDQCEIAFACDALEAAYWQDCLEPCLDEHQQLQVRCSEQPEPCTKVMLPTASLPQTFGCWGKDS